MLCSTQHEAEPKTKTSKQTSNNNNNNKQLIYMVSCYRDGKMSNMNQNWKKALFTQPKWRHKDRNNVVQYWAWNRIENKTETTDLQGQLSQKLKQGGPL